MTRALKMIPTVVLLNPILDTSSEARRGHVAAVHEGIVPQRRTTWPQEGRTSASKPDEARVVATAPETVTSGEVEA